MRLSDFCKSQSWEMSLFPSGKVTEKKPFSDVELGCLERNWVPFLPQDARGCWWIHWVLLGSNLQPFSRSAGFLANRPLLHPESSHPKQPVSHLQYGLLDVSPRAHPCHNFSGEMDLMKVWQDIFTRFLLWLLSLYIFKPYIWWLSVIFVTFLLRNSDPPYS